MREGILVDQIFCIELVQPFETFSEAFGLGCADDLLIFCNSDMSALIRITITFTETVDQNHRVLAAVVDDEGHRNDITVDIEFSFELVSVVAESEQAFFKIFNRRRNFQT